MGFSAVLAFAWPAALEFPRFDTPLLTLTFLEAQYDELKRGEVMLPTLLLNLFSLDT